MRKLLVLSILILFTLSCDKQSHYGQPEPKDLTYKVITIDSCEYIFMTSHQYMDYAGYGFLAHKGNCKYCAERRKNENSSNR
jgi:hypothetical protein